MSLIDLMSLSTMSYNISAASKILSGTPKASLIKLSCDSVIIIFIFINILEL